MSDLKSFYRQNAKDTSTKEKSIAVSDRFVDENDNPIEWKLKSVSPKKLLQIEKASTNSKGEIDTETYAQNLLTSSIIYPDLDNANLQDSYNVDNPQDLLLEMLSSSEFSTLLNEVKNLHRDNRNLQEMVNDVKN